MYPQLGVTTMRPGNDIGDCLIGDNVVLAAEAYVIDQELAQNRVFW